ncbi:hypothetical protein Tco_0515279, partial [Tanacetum coccineum]
CWGTRSNQKKTTRKDRVPDNQHNYVQHTILCANVSVCSAEDCEDQIITLESVLDSVVICVLGIDPHAFTHFRDARKRRRRQAYELTWMKSSEGWWLETSLLEIAQEQYCNKLIDAEAVIDLDDSQNNSDHLINDVEECDDSMDDDDATDDHLLY